MNSECIFCNKNSLIDDENFMVFQSNNPQSELHLLICPKKHMVCVDWAYWNKIYPLVEKLKLKYHINSYSIHMNFNPPRQTILHSHLHFLAGKQHNTTY